jgi:hypothetical protein
MGRVFGGQEKYTSYCEGQTRWKNANPASNITYNAHNNNNHNNQNNNNSINNIYNNNINNNKKKPTTITITNTTTTTNNNNNSDANINNKDKVCDLCVRNLYLSSRSLS